MKKKIAKLLLAPVNDVPKALFVPFIKRRKTSIAKIVLPLLLVITLAWFITVPVHELLHAVGCIVTGGKVKELTIRPIYGGGILARFFSFVSSGGDYAGQLKGFETGGNDFCYFVTVAFPYVLTLFLGMPVLRLASRSGNPIAHGVGALHILLPLSSITGDYYEMGSIIVSRVAGLVPHSEGAKLLRGDDVILVIHRVNESSLAFGSWLVAAGIVMGLVLVWLTWLSSVLIAHALSRKTP